MPVILLDPCMDRRWDSFVESHPFGWVTHLSAWKRLLEAAFPHIRGHYLALVDQDGNIQAGLPIFEVRGPLRGTRLVSIPHATLSDPLVNGKDQMQLLLDEAKKIMGGLGANTLEIRTTKGNHYLEESEFTQDKHFKYHFLDLGLTEEELYKSLRGKGIKHQINRAKKYNFSIKLGQSEEDMAAFYRLYTPKLSDSG